jgi:hypothetical protein
MTPIIGFSPDAEQTTPGLLADCTNLIPTLTGMKGGPSAVTPASTPALADPCTGAAVVSLLNNTRRIIAGTRFAIYELLAGSWSDVSRGSAYTGGSESRWSIAQFGDATIMANRADAMQRSSSGAFADIATAPKAEVVFSVSSFVMALNVNDGADKPDGWHCCAAFDDTDWTPSVTTQSASGRLVATSGPITAGARLGEYAVAYKNRSIYLGQYVGAPVVWDWLQVPGGNAGCVGKDALCDVNGVHFFVGEDNFWLFDGTRPQPIGDGAVRFWFLENSNPIYRYKTIASFDRQNNVVWVYYASVGSDTVDSALVYHVLVKKWGRANMPIQAALEYISPGATIDGLTSYSATIDGLPDVGFDSQYWIAGGRAHSVFDSSNQLQSMTGASSSSMMETGDAGDDDAVIMMTQVRVRYAKKPTSATVLTLNKMNSGEDYASGPSGAMNDGKFDALKSARWHKARITFTGPVTATHIDAKYQPVGER